MKITRVRAIPMSDPVPKERQHRTDLGTKIKSDATLILVETDKGLTGMGAALGTPPVSNEWRSPSVWPSSCSTTYGVDCPFNATPTPGWPAMPEKGRAEEGRASRWCL